MADSILNIIIKTIKRGSGEASAKTGLENVVAFMARLQHIPQW